MNSLKVMRWLSLFVALPICVLTILELPVHVSLGEKEIRDCGYAFSICKVYRYSDAQRLTQIDGFRFRDGKLTARAGLVVDFKDARRWSSGNIGDFQTTVNPELLELFEAKTQLPLNHLEAEEDIPALQR